MFKIAFTTISSKVVAGSVGALLAGALSAGAISGTVALTSNASDIPQEPVENAPTPVVEDPAAVAVEDPAAVEAARDVEGGAVVVEGPGSESDETKAATEPVDLDLSTVPVPTSVSEAAKTHAFDEVCGNHGKYVSHFARYGEEPECATSARTAAASDGAAAGTASEATLEGDSAEDESAPQAKADKRDAKAEKNAAKAENKAAKAENKPAKAAKADEKPAKAANGGKKAARGGRVDR